MRYLSSIITLFVLFAPAMARCEESTPQKLQQYLEHEGDRLDCYFTLEDATKGLGPTPLEITTVENAILNSSVDELIGTLQKLLPKYVIKRRNESSMVVHIVSRKLDSDKTYALSLSTGINYKGSLFGLADAIGKQLKVDLADQVLYPVPSRINPDYQTLVNITSDGAVAREILTDYVPLSEYSRILWRAVTREDEKLGHRTEVAYFGLARRKSATTKKSVSFSDGVVAFASIPATPDMIDSAIKIVDVDRLGEKPDQFRWTLLWLGKNKVVKAIPMLIRHVDYRYTKSGLLLEDYPALAALVAFSDPNYLVASLKEETDGTRRRLLLTAILFTAPMDKADTLVKATVSDMSNPEISAQVKKTWIELVKKPPVRTEILR